MLKSLNIRGFAVIDELRVNFGSGLNVLTGETGSGKSIVVDALTLLLGGRSSTVQIRTGESQAEVEAIFEIADKNGREGVREALSEIGLPESDQLTIRREIHLTGKGRMFLNQKSVTAGTLRKLQPWLAAIHGQGEQRSLLSPQSHRELLDHFGQCLNLKKQIRGISLALKSSERELKLITGNRVEHERSIDSMQRQLVEIDALHLRSGEDDELLAERNMLAHAERIVELGSQAYYDLYERDDSILARLALIRRQLDELGGLVGDGEIAMDSLISGIASLTDVAETMRTYGTGVEYSPAKLAQVESRLAELERIKRRYGASLEGILKIRDDLSEKLSGTGSLAERVDALRNEVEVLRQDYMEVAEKLSSCRRTAAPLLQQKVMEGLGHVAMGQAKFLISVETNAVDDEEPTEDAEATEVEAGSQESGFYSPNGLDFVEFLLSANPGESSRPLSYVASGGELSRLMLVLRTAGQEDQPIETVVFDEIDAGIGGRVAEAVGQRLKSLSSGRQVFCVTHQAQIAKYADHHFAVTKEIERERTSTRVRELGGDERIDELARMIGGDEKSEKTREAAKWLLESAKSSRRTRTKKSGQS